MKSFLRAAIPKIPVIRHNSTEIASIASVVPVAVVTGASRGIGKAIALKLAEHGCVVVVNYNSNEESANEVCKEINEKYSKIGSKAIPIRADVSNADAVKSMFQVVKRTVRPMPGIDVVRSPMGCTKLRIPTPETPMISYVFACGIMYILR